MRMTLCAAMLLLPLTSFADHLDVIQVELKDGCSMTQYVEIKNDFNEKWGKKYGYKAELIVPIQSDDLKTIYWVGRSASAAAYGKAWDTWRDELVDPNTVAGKLAARFSECNINVSRRGYDVY